MLSSTQFDRHADFSPLTPAVSDRVRMSNLFGAARTYLKGAAMTQADHYRDQSERARRLAEAVKDPEASEKLIQMAEEFRLYAERLEEAH